MPDTTSHKKRGATPLVVNEIFGPTIQGEGPNAGAPAIFLRLGGCNLACVWCDTQYTWNWKLHDPRVELHPMKRGAVLDKIDQLSEKMKPPITLVVTGGEPLLQAKALFGVLNDFWHRQGHNAIVEIETAGTIKPGELSDVAIFNVSPKLSHSGNPLEKRINPDALGEFSWLARMQHKAIFKFVVQQPSDFIELDSLVESYRLEPVFIMPEGISGQTLHHRANALLPMIIERGYRLTPRLHVDIFGNRRGV